MQVPRALLIVVALTVVILAACGGDSDDQPALSDVTSQPGRLPTQTPVLSATPVPLPTLEPTQGTLVYLLDDDLWVAALDGSSAPRQVTDGAECVQYAGSSRREDGGVDVFYLALHPDDPDTPRQNLFLDVYRTPLEGGDADLVFGFSGFCPRLPFSVSDASVSPDGSLLAYADNIGLAFKGIESSANGRLAVSRACNVPPDFPADCSGYRWPEWSPAGDAIRAARLGYEGGITLLVDMSESPPTLTETRYGGETSDWSANGEHLCLSEPTHGDRGSIIVLEVATGEAVDALASLDLERTEEGFALFATSGCVWSSGNQLAIGFQAEGVSDLIVVDEGLQLVRRIELGDWRPSLVDWLPSETGVMVNLQKFGYIWMPAIVQLDGLLLRLPFEADFALAVIP